VPGFADLVAFRVFVLKRFHHFRRRYVHGATEFNEHFHRRLAYVPLDLRKVASIDSGAQSQLFLCEARPQPRISNQVSKHDVKAIARTAPPSSGYSLQDSVIEIRNIGNSIFRILLHLEQKKISSQQKRLQLWKELAYGNRPAARLAETNHL
jgi:hypothetical protein